MQVFRNGWFVFVCIALLLAANVSVYRILLARRALEVSVLDAGDGKGSGNAVLVRTPSGATLLIDAGAGAGILRALGSALPPWQRRIDAAILTGTQSSLVGGMREVESRYRVSARTRVGGSDAPYGASFAFDGARIEITAPATLTIFYGATSIGISSSTPAGVYLSDGRTMTKPR